MCSGTLRQIPSISASVTLHSSLFSQWSQPLCKYENISRGLPVKLFPKYTVTCDYILFLWFEARSCHISKSYCSKRYNCLWDVCWYCWYIQKVLVVHKPAVDIVLHIGLLLEDGWILLVLFCRVLLRLDPSPNDYEESTVELFGFQWVTEMALVESCGFLFGLLRYDNTVFYNSSTSVSIPTVRV